jgi:hypothetical protein
MVAEPAPRAASETIGENDWLDESQLSIPIEIFRSNALRGDEAAGTVCIRGALHSEHPAHDSQVA